MQRMQRRRSVIVSFIFLFILSIWGLTGLHGAVAHASARKPTENNGAAPTPFMGWSSWYFIGRNPTEANVKAQANAEASKLKSYGYNYILLDDFWYLNPSTTVDANGYWAVDTSKFPDGLSGLATYV